MQYKVQKNGVSFFYTDGLRKELGYELKYRVDTLTALRSGEKVAKEVFDTILERIKDEKVYAGMFIDNIDFNPRKEPYAEGEIRTATKTKCILQEDGHFEGARVYSIVLARFTN